MKKTREEFEGQLGDLLRRRGAGITADLTDAILAYWNGHSVVFVTTNADGSGAVDEEFEMDDRVWEKCHAAFEDWMSQPTFTVRPEVRRWLSDAPPYVPGVLKDRKAQ